MNAFQVIGFMGRMASYWATHQTRAPMLCALAFEMEMLGLPQGFVLRRLLDASIGEGHCREMWMEEMGLD